jgi:hypothetical protein
VETPHSRSRTNNPAASAASNATSVTVPPRTPLVGARNPEELLAVPPTPSVAVAGVADTVVDPGTVVAPGSVLVADSTVPFTVVDLPRVVDVPGRVVSEPSVSTVGVTPAGVGVGVGVTVCGPP